MPTNIAYRSRSTSSHWSDVVEALRSDDMTVLLLWTITGLAISLGFLALGVYPDVSQDFLIFG